MEAGSRSWASTLSGPNQAGCGRWAAPGPNPNDVPSAVRGSGTRQPGLIKRGPHDAAAAAEHAVQLLKSAHPPTAIFAASDTQAIGVLAAADRLGVPVPGGLSVIGFDDIESAAFLGLSTVRQPLTLSGAEGARRLCALLRGEKVRPVRQELPVELMARDSSARAQ